MSSRPDNNIARKTLSPKGGRGGGHGHGSVAKRLLNVEETLGLVPNTEERKRVGGTETGGREDKGADSFGACGMAALQR